MADIINLRRARKAKSRVANDAKAEQNRLTFGRTKIEREVTAKENAQTTRRLEGHKLEGQKLDAKRLDPDE